jgi:hypothetical protein
MCDYCELGRILATDLLSFILHNFRLDLKQSFSNDTWKSVVMFMSEFENEDVYENYLDDCVSLERRTTELELVREEIDQLIAKKNELDKIQKHREISNNQRLAYYRSIYQNGAPNLQDSVEFLRGKVLIDIDWKGQISLGKSQNQISGEFRAETATKKRVTCLSFGIFYVDSFINKENVEEEFVNCLNVDVISDQKDMHTYTVIQYFNHVMELYPQRFEENDFIIWADCG